VTRILIYHNVIMCKIVTIASFSFRSVCASNRIQIQPSVLEPVDNSINIVPLDITTFRQPLKCMTNICNKLHTWLVWVWTMLKFYSEAKPEALGE